MALGGVLAGQREQPANSTHRFAVTTGDRSGGRTPGDPVMATESSHLRLPEISRSESATGKRTTSAPLMSEPQAPPILRARPVPEAGS